MSALPEGVSIAPSETAFVSQRGYWTPPFVSCMFAALGMLLVHAGYKLPLPRKIGFTPPDNFVYSLHKASGAPLDQGSNVRDSQIALRKLLPDAPILFGKVTSQELIAELEKGAMVRVAVKCPLLPAHLRRFVGDYQGKHAMAIGGYRPGELFVLDPMGRSRNGYQGEWTALGPFLSAVPRNAEGEIVVTLAYQDAAVPVVDPHIAEIASLKAENIQLKADIQDLLLAAEMESAMYDQLQVAVSDFVTEADSAMAKLLDTLDALA